MAIIEKIQKLNRWYIRWGIDATEAIFLNFDHDPLDTEAQAAANKFIADRLTAQARDKRIARISELLDILKNKTIDYVEMNPTATKADILTFMKNLIQSGGLN